MIYISRECGSLGLVGFFLNERRYVLKDAHLSPLL